MAEIPKTIKAGPLEYEVRLVPAREIPKCNGLCDYDDMWIKLRKAMKSLKRKEVLLHEAVHTIHYNRGVQGQKLTDEDWLDHTIPGLLALIRDNPELIAYLTANDHEPSRPTETR